MIPPATLVGVQKSGARSQHKERCYDQISPFPKIIPPAALATDGLVMF